MNYSANMCGGDIVYNIFPANFCFSLNFFLSNLRQLYNVIGVIEADGTLTLLGNQLFARYRNRQYALKLGPHLFGCQRVDLVIKFE